MIGHDCKHDAELIDELVKISEAIDRVQWGSIFILTDAQQDHPNRECRCPLTLAERMASELAGEVAETLAEASGRIKRFVGLKHERGQQ